MKNSKKFKRDNFNWKKVSHFDKWWRKKAPVKYSISSRRSIEKANANKILKGEDPDILDWPYKWQSAPDYYW